MPTRAPYSTAGGDALARWCRGSGVTFSALARLIPCSVAYPAMIAKGTRPSWSMACRIEEITNGDVSKDLWFPPRKKIVGTTKEIYSMDDIFNDEKEDQIDE